MTDFLSLICNDNKFAFDPFFVDLKDFDGPVEQPCFYPGEQIGRNYALLFDKYFVIRTLYRHPEIISEPESPTESTLSKPKRKRTRTEKESKFVSDDRHVVPASTRKLLYILQRLKNENEMKLYAFVNYDKYDSLVYFPCNLARAYTSGNLSAYTKLLTRQSTSRCTTTFSELRTIQTIQNGQKKPISLTITSLMKVARPGCIRLFALTQDAHPDCVCNIMAIQVIGNTICADMRYSYIDVPDMYSSTVPCTCHTFLPQCGNRKAQIGARIKLSTYSAAMQQQINDLIDTGDELIFHCTIRMVFTFDQICSKVTDLQSTIVKRYIEHKRVEYTLE